MTPPLIDTYLEACLKDGKTLRWPDRAMPLQVYIAPFQWHETKKQQQALIYQQMVLEALEFWSKASGGLVKFQVVSRHDQSQIDFKWRRVDRKTLGHCEYAFNAEHLLYSAEIQIGISDGLLHQQYNDLGEVQHTIYHEVAHALGVTGHSNQPGDIMYVPHQFGVLKPTERDKETLRWLYKLPPGFDYQQTGRQQQLEAPYTLNDVLGGLSGNSTMAASPNKTKPTPPAPAENKQALIKQHDILSHMGQFHLATQHIRVKPEAQRLFVDRANPKQPPPQQPQ
jgi:hypothetical protein